MYEFDKNDNSNVAAMDSAEDTSYTLDATTTNAAGPSTGQQKPFSNNFNTWKTAMLICSGANIVLSVLYICYALLVFILVLAIPPHFVSSAFVQLMSTAFQLFSIAIAVSGIVAALRLNPIATDIVRSPTSSHKYIYIIMYANNTTVFAQQNFYGNAFLAVAITLHFLVMGIAFYSGATWPVGIIQHLFMLVACPLYATFAVVAFFFKKFLRQEQ